MTTFLLFFFLLLMGFLFYRVVRVSLMERDELERRMNNYPKAKRYPKEVEKKLDITEEFYHHEIKPNASN